MKWYMVCVSKAVQLLRFYGFLAKERDGNEICLLLIRNGFELSKRFSDFFLLSAKLYPTYAPNAAWTRHGMCSRYSSFNWSSLQIEFLTQPSMTHSLEATSAVACRILSLRDADLASMILWHMILQCPNAKEIPLLPFQQHEVLPVTSCIARFRFS